MTGDARGRSFDRVAHCYDETRALPEAVREAVTAGIVRVVRDVAPHPRLLEVGIGTGRTAVPLADAGVGVVGVDLAPAMLARLRRRAPGLAVCRADGAELPFRACTFDAVLFVHVLHLVQQPAAVVSAARAVTRPGGVLLFSREDFESDPLRPLSAMLREIVADLTGEAYDPKVAHTRAAEAFATGAGSADDPAEEIVLARWTEQMSGRRWLEGIAGHVWSSTWHIPDAVMPELMRRLTPRVEGLIGGLDRPIGRQAAFVLTVARR
jgi:ubiquinone/menaquinone biosynthesis C-methylase UbiE